MERDREVMLICPIRPSEQLSITCPELGYIILLAAASSFLLGRVKCVYLEQLTSFLIQLVINGTYGSSSDLNQAAVRARACEVRSIGSSLLFEKKIK